eukprot:366355-Chlamydomonas_euryale.AAC.11
MRTSDRTQCSGRRGRCMARAEMIRAPDKAWVTAAVVDSGLDVACAAARAAHRDLRWTCCGKWCAADSAVPTVRCRYCSGQQQLVGLATSEK